jgi:guanylate kinase
MNRSTLFVFTGTSGSGRKTIAHMIGREFGLAHVISCTTRMPRIREQVVIKDYHYLTREQFEEEERAGQFIQTVTIDKERYGVRRSDLEGALNSGKPVYLILNRVGASLLKKLYGDRVVRIFLYVDKQTVRERLESKGRPYEVVQHYLEHYMDEVTYRKECEHICENVELKHTLEEMRRIIGVHMQE